MSAPASRSRSAARLCPPWQACQKVSLRSASVGGGDAARSSSSRVSIPRAAACQRASTGAPRATSSRATCQQPYPIALSSCVPIDPPGVWRSAPPSMRTAATSTSSVLAAQWRASPAGRRPCRHWDRRQLRGAARPLQELLGSSPASPLRSAAACPSHLQGLCGR